MRSSREISRGVVSLVNEIESLRDELIEANSQIETLREEKEELEKRVAELEEAAASPAGV